jgi:hypothetical protein
LRLLLGWHTHPVCPRASGIAASRFESANAELLRPAVIGAGLPRTRASQGCGGDLMTAIRPQLVPLDHPQTARIRLLRGGADPCGGYRIGLGPLGPEGLGDTAKMRRSGLGHFVVHRSTTLPPRIV